MAVSSSCWESLRTSVRGRPSVTALIPGFFGVPLVLLGAAARRDTWRSGALYVALVIGLLGALAALGRGIPALASESVKASTGVQLLMGAALAVYTVWGVRSILMARRE